MSNINQPIFQDPEDAREYLESLRWPEGPICPHCGNIEGIYELNGKSTRPGLYKCKECRKQFTVTVGTLFERSKIPLNRWLLAVYLLCSSKKGISSHQLHRMLGVTYKTAWFMTHRIREAMDVLLKDELAPHVKKIVGEDMVYYGDVSGILEQVNIHGKKRDFYLYPVSGAPRIKCRFTKEDLEIGINSVNRYLKVTGRVKYHQKSSHPYEIDVDLGKVVVFPPEKELPTLFDLRGIAPDATGDLTTEEFISRLRGDG